VASLKGITSHTGFHKHFNGAPPLFKGGVVMTILSVVIEGQWPSDMEMNHEANFWNVRGGKSRNALCLKSKGIVEKGFEDCDIDLLESSIELGDKVFN
jgi:hypothetical protein